MASFASVESDLKRQIGVTTVGKLVAIISKVDSYQSKTDHSFRPQKDTYADNERMKGILLNTKDLKVDFSYQRFLKLRVLVLRLQDYKDKPKNFLPELVGTIDVMVRTNGDKALWDGLRRCVLGGLKGVWELAASLHYHQKGTSILDQIAYEARLFSTKNGRGHESMRVDELFKSDYVAKERDAITVYNVMKASNLDKLNVVKNDGYDIGAFGLFQNHVLGIAGADKVDSIYFEKASAILQASWPAPDKGRGGALKGYLLVGFALYLKKLESLKDRCSGPVSDDQTSLPCDDIDSIDYTDDTYLELFKKYASSHSQTDITKITQSNKQVESACYNIFTKVLFSQADHSAGLKTMWIEELNLDTSHFLPSSA